MNRGIFFRAKHIHAMDSNEHLNGTWVHGYLSDENHIYDKSLDGEFLVDEKTICRYVNLTDLKGKEIWENDILMCHGNPDDLVKAVFGEFNVIEVESEEVIDSVIGWHYEVIPTDGLSKCEPFCYSMPMEKRLEENNVKNENNRKKEYLRGYRANRRRISRIDDEVRELRELAESTKATDYSGMPHGSGNQKDLSDELARIDSLEKKLEKEKSKCIESYISIENQIKTVKNEDENDVLFYRYVKGLRWWEIAEKMEYTERWIHKLHGKALEHLKIPK